MIFLVRLLSFGDCMPKEGYRVITVKEELYNRLATVAKEQGKTIQELLTNSVEGLRGFESLFPHQNFSYLSRRPELSQILIKLALG